MIPEQNITYHIGLAGTNSTRLVKYDIARDTWDILNSPNKSWESGTFIPIGRKGIVVMIGVADDEPDVAVSSNNSGSLYDVLII
jgi:hypothetical protein